MTDVAQTWFVKVGEDVFGPYPSDRVRAFIGEGRLRNHSLVSRRRDGGFAPIARIPDLLEAPKPGAKPVAPAREPSALSRDAEPVRLEPSGAVANFVIIARFDVTEPERLVERLSRFGALEPIGPNAWALRAATTVEALRNALTRGLTARETLFIVDATRDKAAWFNLGSERDARLRALRDDADPR